MVECNEFAAGTSGGGRYNLSLYSITNSSATRYLYRIDKEYKSCAWVADVLGHIKNVVRGCFPCHIIRVKKTTGCASGSNKGFTTNKYFVTKKQVALLLQ
jgi:hypothetical protein